MKLLYIIFSLIISLFVAHETTELQGVFHFVILFVWGGIAFFIIELIKNDDESE